MDTSTTAPLISIIDKTKFRVENGTELTASPSPSLKESSLQRTLHPIENPESESHWFFNYFLGKRHQNYVGVDDVVGPFALSMAREGGEENDVDTGNMHYYRIIVWAADGIEKMSAPTRAGQSLGPQDLLRIACPRISARKLRQVFEPEIQEDLLKIEQQQSERLYKFGVLYLKDGQSTENEMYNNRHKVFETDQNDMPFSKDYAEFLSMLGDTVELNGHQGYRGGLDVKTNTTGSHSVYTKYGDYEIMFHVSTLLPYTQGDEQQVERKRHIGNDISLLIFIDGKNSSFNPNTMTSHFNHIFGVVRVEDEDHYRVGFCSVNPISPYGAMLPDPPVFRKGTQTRHFLMTKLVNGQRAALHSAPSFAAKMRRTLLSQLQAIHTSFYQKAHTPYSPTTILLSTMRRRSNSMVCITKGKELKIDLVSASNRSSPEGNTENSDVELPPASSKDIKLSPNAQFNLNVFDSTVILRDFPADIVCLDVTELNSKPILVFASEDGIYVYDITQVDRIRKVNNIKDIIMIEIMEAINQILFLSEKSGVLYYPLQDILDGYLWDETLVCRLEKTKGATHLITTPSSTHSYPSFPSPRSSPLSLSTSLSTPSPLTFSNSAPMPTTNSEELKQSTDSSSSSSSSSGFFERTFPNLNRSLGSASGSGFFGSSSNPNSNSKRISAGKSSPSFMSGLLGSESKGRHSLLLSLSDLTSYMSNHSSGSNNSNNTSSNNNNNSNNNSNRSSLVNSSPGEIIEPNSENGENDGIQTFDTTTEVGNNRETNSTPYFLATYTKKTVLIYEWLFAGKQFKLLREITLNDICKSMVFCGDLELPLLCVAYGNFFGTIDVLSGSFNDICKLDNTADNVTALEGELLLTSDRVSYFVSTQGVKTRSFEFKWGAIPEAISFSFPYICAFSQPFIEVRTLVNGKLIQTIPFPSAKHLQTRSGALFVSSQSSLAKGWTNVIQVGQMTRPVQPTASAINQTTNTANLLGSPPI